MRGSHRLSDNRRDTSGHPDSKTLADFHTSLLEVLPHAAAYVAQDGTILVHNNTLLNACLGLGVEAVPERLQKLLAEASWKRCEAVLSAAFAGVPAQATGRISLRSGSTFCHNMLCTSFVFLSSERQAVLVQFDMDDVGQDRIPAMEEELPDGPSGHPPVRERGVLEHFPDDVLVFEGSEKVEEKAHKLLEATGSTYETRLLVEALSALEDDQPQTLHIPESKSPAETGNGGDRLMCEIRLVPIPCPSGKADAARASMAIIRRNVDCPREIAENRRLAYLDPLTGLENRRAFTRSMKREWTRLAADRDTGLAVYYIDLDEFKKVNDLGGHDAGDDMLLRVASCLRLTLGEFGTVARIGGDEFAGMVPAANEEAALDFAEKILDGFGRIRLEVGERIFTIGGSIGVAFIENGVSLNNADAPALLALADRACLRGKRFGGQSVHLHKVQAGDCMPIGSELSELPEPGSFRASELTLYAMPIICLKKARVCGSEVLLRLQGDRARGLSSRAWISAAERAGFIAKVDAWTLDKVLDAAERGPSRSVLTMNVSAESARDPNFRDGLYHRLSANPLLASKLCLEIAEKDFLREPANVESFFKFISELGCQTAIDDFAGHWPVLSRLTGLRVEWIKLEASLTHQVAEEPAKAAILNGLVRAAHELGIKVIAKHVETAEEAELLRNLDIEAAQGFYFGRPEPWPGA